MAFYVKSTSDISVPPSVAPVMIESARGGRGVGRDSVSHRGGIQHVLGDGREKHIPDTCRVVRRACVMTVPVTQAEPRHLLLIRIQVCRVYMYIG